MKILIICSKKFYSNIDKYERILKSNGHEVFMPNCYNKPESEEEAWKKGKEEHRKFKAKMYNQSENIIRNMDAVLVLNFDKEKDGIICKNYIGGATFLEMYDAFRLNKKIYMYNSIPECLLYDEIDGLSPIILNGKIDQI